MDPVVAFQGERGAFSETAAQALLSRPHTLLPCVTFDDVVGAVEAGSADFGVLPVENLIAGDVLAALGAMSAGVETVAEHLLPVRLALIGLPDASIGGLRAALSHPVALRQCTRFFAAHPHVEPRAAHDTAGAARLVAERGDAALAAIAPAGAAERYGLKIVAQGLEDRPDNATRFVLVRRRQQRVGGRSEPDRT